MEEERSNIHGLNAFRLFSTIVDNISARHREESFANFLYKDGTREKAERERQREAKNRRRKDDQPRKSDLGKEK